MPSSPMLYSHPGTHVKRDFHDILPLAPKGKDWWKVLPIVQFSENLNKEVDGMLRQHGARIERPLSEEPDYNHFPSQEAWAWQHHKRDGTQCFAVGEGLVMLRFDYVYYHLFSHFRAELPSAFGHLMDLYFDGGYTIGAQEIHMLDTSSKRVYLRFRDDLYKALAHTYRLIDKHNFANTLTLVLRPRNVAALHRRLLRAFPYMSWKIEPILGYCGGTKRPAYLTLDGELKTGLAALPLQKDEMTERLELAVLPYLRRAKLALLTEPSA